MLNRTSLGAGVALLGLLATGMVSAEEIKTHPTKDAVAIVNGVSIEKRELDNELLRVQKLILGAGRPLTCNQIAAVQKDVLESIMRRQVLFQESRKAGIKPDDASIKADLAGLRRQFATDADYQAELARRNMTEDALRAELELNNVVQQYVEKQFAPKAVVADSELVAFYEGHIENFKQPLQVRASHILIHLDPSWDDARKQEARLKAEKILKSLKSGKDFSALAREQSDGPTRTSGGELGLIKTGSLDKALEKVVFSLKPGEISDVVETSYGFHLFKVGERKPETVVAFDSVKEQIRKHLVQEKAGQEAEVQAKKLLEKAKVEILPTDEAASGK
jgi:peptidyl-prolyl cis-trans isomerase C